MPITCSESLLALMPMDSQIHEFIKPAGNKLQGKFLNSKNSIPARPPEVESAAPVTPWMERRNSRGTFKVQALAEPIHLLATDRLMQ